MKRKHILVSSASQGQKEYSPDSFEEIVRRAESVLPGGVLGRHTYPDGVAHIPASGQGARITNHVGREYVDYSCGGGSLILGYSHPTVVSAIQEQATRATQFVSILNMPALRLAERIKELVGWNDNVRLALSGAESVMFSLRLARAATGRDKIVKFDGAYHGNCDYALWNADPESATVDGTGKAESAGIPKLLHDLVLIAPYNDLETTEQIIDREWRDIAAVIVEPVQRYYAAFPEFLSGLRRLCDRHGIVLIFDEIVTGFRHSLGGAAEMTGVVPDLSVFGKALGGGLPVSAVVGKASIMDHGNPQRGGPEDGFCYVTSSQAGNPLGCAAGLATLNELARPGVMTKFHQCAETLKEGLRDLVRKRDDAQVVGVGPLWDIVFSTADINDHRSAEIADRQKHLQFHLGLLRNGVMVRVGGRSYFSTSHQKPEIEHTLRAAEAALKEVDV